MPQSPQQRCAVFVDGSAIFFACRNLFPSGQLKYDKLVELFGRQFGSSADKPKTGRSARLLTQPRVSGDSTIWMMWTSVVAENEGQARFLEFIEKKLGWAIRTFAPSDSLLIDPHSTLSISGESTIADRLTRFDASIAYMIGRVAEDRQVIVVTDSFAVAEPLVRAYEARRLKQNLHGPSAIQHNEAPNVLAFFGRAIDPRWHSVLRKDQFGDPDVGPLSFDDLDQHSELLFGAHKPAGRLWTSEDIPGTQGFNER